MVDVVIVLPPAYTETADEISDYDADRRVDMERVSYAHMPGVMDCENELMPEETQRDGREEEVLRLEEVYEGREEGNVACAFEGVGVIRAVEEAGDAELLLQSSVLGNDPVL